MEKSSPYNPSYPQMPPQMSDADAAAAMHHAPPSYDQATTSSSYAGNVHGPATQQQPNYAAYGNQAGFVPPPHSYATQQNVPVVQQPVVFIQQQAVLPLGPEPTYITCPACHVQKLTRIEYEPSSRTHLMAAILCLLGFWCCACVPYCATSCMNTNHYCGNCNKFLGSYGGSL